MKLDELLKRIKSFRKLKAGWDSYDGKPFSEETIQLALVIANRLPAKEDFFVAPCSDGEIMFESNESGIKVYRYYREEN